MNQSLFALLMIPPALAAADPVEVRGAGATTPAPIYAQWVHAYHAAQPGVVVDYQAIGSGSGIRAITAGELSFAGSDEPLTAGMQHAGIDLIMLPTLAWPLAVIYHDAKIRELTLDAPTLASICLGEITRWDDAAIARTNPGVALPTDPIVFVHRSDSSGDNAIFTDYLEKVSPAWAQRVGRGPTIRWPAGIGGKGGASVVEAIDDTEGGIGVAAFAFVRDRQMQIARIINRSGKVVTPSVAGVAAAIQQAGATIGADGAISITDAVGETAYPLCGFSYLLVHQDLSYLGNARLAQETAAFLWWCEHDGLLLARANNPAEFATASGAMLPAIETMLMKLTAGGKRLLGPGGTIKGP